MQDNRHQQDTNPDAGMTISDDALAKDAERFRRDAILESAEDARGADRGPAWRVDSHAAQLAEQLGAFEFVPRSRGSRCMALRFQKHFGPVLSKATCDALNEMDEEQELLAGRLAMIRAHAAERFPMGALSEVAFTPGTTFAHRTILPLFLWNGEVRRMRTFEVGLCQAAERAYERMINARIRARASARAGATA